MIVAFSGKRGVGKDTMADHLVSTDKKWIVALSGKRGSGKDTMADYLVSKHGFKKLSFAKILKDNVSQEYGIAREWFEDREQKEKPIWLRVITSDDFSKHIHEYMFREFRSWAGQQPLNYRHINGEFYGVFENNMTEYLYWTPRALCILEGSIKRCVDPQHWVRKIMAQMDEKSNYVLSDWRYPSEIVLFKQPLMRVRTHRPELVHTSTDPSECALDNFTFDQVFVNDGSIEDFHTHIDEWIKSYL